MKNFSHLSRNSSTGFTLIELLVGLSIGAVVMAGLGGSLLVSDARVQRSTQRNLAISDMRTRFNSLVSRDIAASVRIETTGGAIAASCPSSPSVILVGPGDSWRVAYGVRAITIPESSTYTGPFVVWRCGPPYAAVTNVNLLNNGIPFLDPSPTAAWQEQIVLDRLGASSDFTVTRYPSTGIVTGVKLAVAITLAPGQTAVVQSANRIGNPLYPLINNLASCSTSPCFSSSGTNHYYPPSSGTIQGPSSDQNIFYFNGKRSAYTLTADGTAGTTCQRANCTVSSSAGSLRINYGDVLVFQDQYIGIRSF